jgi:hypothetical protein
MGGQDKAMPAAATAAQPADPNLQWDTDLDTLKVSLTPAGAAPGASYWRLIKADYDASASGHNTAYCEVLDENGARIVGQKLTMTWPGASGSATTENKPAPEFAANFGIGGSYNPKDGPGSYAISVDGLPSDRVTGLGRPGGHDAVFYLTWRRSAAGTGMSKSVIRGMVVGGQAGQAVTLKVSGGQARQATLDGAGAYSFSGLPAGTYSVDVGGASLPNLTVDGTASLDAPLIDIRPRGSVIKGTVHKATGEPAVGSKATLTSTGTHQENVTDKSGAYQFASLLAGSYTIEVAGLVQTARVNGRDTATADFQLQPEQPRKPIAQFLLFGQPQQVGTRANLLLAEDYILKFTPAVGFNVDEATLAANVIIVGDIQAVSAADEEKLKASGCQVTRLGGGPYAIEQSFSELVKGKGLSPVPADRLRAPDMSVEGANQREP